MFNTNYQISNSHAQEIILDSNRDLQQNEIQQDSNLRKGSKTRQHLFELRCLDNNLLYKNRQRDDSIIQNEDNQISIPLNNQQQKRKHQQERQVKTQQMITDNNQHQDLQEPITVKNYEINKSKKKVDFFGASAPWRILKKIELAKKFSNNMLSLSRKLLFKKLNNNHFTAINDKSYINKIVSTFEVNTSFLKIFKKIKIFNPDNLASIAWDLIILIFSMLNVLLAPLQISFDIDNNIVSQFYLISMGFFFIDIIITFNMGIYYNFTVLTDRKKIINTYLKTGFLFDLVPTICQLLYVLTYQHKVFLSFQLIRAFLLQSRRRKIEEHFHLAEQYPTFNTLFKLLFLILSMGHICACGFKLVASSQPIGVSTWLTIRNVYSETWWTQYVEAMYFAFITMITVGFGDIVPISFQEKIYTIFMTLVACGVFGYTINTIGTIFQGWAQQNSELKKQKFEVLKYMQNRQIDKNLQLKVLKYLDFMAQKQEESNVKGQEIIQMISNNLREEVLKEYFGKILFQQKNFKNNFCNNAIEEMTVKMKEMVLGPGEIIYNQGDFDRKLFFIKKGEIEFFEKNKNKKNFNLKDNSDFHTIQDWSIGFIKASEKHVFMLGYSEFITGSCRQLSARSVNISHAIYLDFEDFLDIIKEYPKDYEKFCLMKDHEQEFQENQYCSLCNQYGHFQKECPLVFYQPAKYLVISKANHSLVQERINIKRKKKKKFNVFHDMPIIRQHLKELRINLIQYADNNQSMDISVEFFETLANFSNIGDKEFFMSVPIFLYDKNLKQSHLDYVFSEESFYTQQTNDLEEGIEEAEEDDEIDGNTSQVIQELKHQNQKNCVEQQQEEIKENIIFSLSQQLQQEDSKDKLSSRVIRQQNSNQDIQDTNSICDQNNDLNQADSGQNTMKDLQTDKQKEYQQQMIKSQIIQQNSIHSIQSSIRGDIDDKNKESQLDQQSQQNENEIDNNDYNIVRNSNRSLTNLTNKSIFREKNKINEKRTSIMDMNIEKGSTNMSNLERQYEKKSSNTSIKKDSRKDLQDQLRTSGRQRHQTSKKTIQIVQMNQAEQLSKMLYDILKNQSELQQNGTIQTNNELTKNRFQKQKYNQQSPIFQQDPLQQLQNNQNLSQHQKISTNQSNQNKMFSTIDNTTNRRASISKNPLLESLLVQRKGQRNSTIIQENTKKLDSIQMMIENLEDTFNNKLKKIMDQDNFNKERSVIGKSHTKTYSKMNSKCTMYGDTDEQFFIKGFEKMKEFSIYNPNFNFVNIIKDYRKKQLKKSPITTVKMNSKRFNNASLTPKSMKKQ